MREHDSLSKYHYCCYYYYYYADKSLFVCVCVHLHILIFGMNFSYVNEEGPSVCAGMKLYMCIAITCLHEKGVSRLAHKCREIILINVLFEIKINLLYTLLLLLLLF